MCNVIWKSLTHGHPNLLQHHPTAHILGPCIDHVKFATSSSCLLQFSLGSPLDTRQVFYITPALLCWFIVVSSVLHLFSFLDRSSLIPTMPTKVHHHIQGWIHSMPVTPCSRPLPPHSGGATHHGFHPKYPLKFCQNHHWMTCHPPWLPQLLPSFFNLLLMAWTCWMNSLHSWFTWLLF